MGKMLHEPIALDVNHMMSDVIGFQYGIDPCQVDGMKDAASAAQRNVEKNRGTGWLGWMPKSAAVPASMSRTTSTPSAWRRFWM